MNGANTNRSDAYRRILDAIDRGDLKSGDRLRESDLAARFGVSRTPIREALRRLEAQGLVVHQPHKGAVVAELDYDQLSELYAVRAALEGTAARWAAMRAAPEEIDILRAMIEADRPKVGDPAALSAGNRRFHAMIHRASHNRYLNTMLDTMRVHLALLDGSTLGLPERGEKSLDDHAEILAAIAARDGDRAEDAARRHIAEGLRARIAMRVK